METRALRRTLLRDEISRREAQRLELEAPSALIQDALASTLVGIEEEFGGAEAWRTWAERRYELPATQVRLALRHRLEENLRFQCVVAGSTAVARKCSIRAWVFESEPEAQDAKRKREHGADPSRLGSPLVEEVVPLLSDSYAEEHFGGRTVGELVGPIQLEGDLSWHLFEIQEFFHPASGMPPLRALLDEVRASPPGPLATRAWWDSMVNRYTAVERPPDLQNPLRTFGSR